MPWIFSYLRIDLEEIDVGFYETKEESEKGRLYMKGLGAIVSEDSREVPEDYQLYKGERKV